MILVLLVLVVVIGGALVLATTTAFDWRLAAVAAAALAGVLVVAAVLTVGLGRGREEATRTGAPEQAATQQTPGVELRPVDAVLTLRGGDDETFARPAAVIDELPDDAVRLVAVPGDGRVLLQQCALGPDDAPRACGRAIPVGWSEAVQAGLVDLHRILPTVAGPTVDCATSRCAVVARADYDDRPVTAMAVLVFGQVAPAPSLSLSHATGRHPGDRVTVALRGLPPGERVQVTWCVPPGPVEPRACGAPASTITTAADDGGNVALALAVPTKVGTMQVRCGPRQACAVAVIGSTVPLTPATVGFAGARGPDVPVGRAVAALAAAALLGVLALWLLHRRPGERAPDPFEGVSLAVPEWNDVDLTVETAAETAMMH